MVLHQLTLVCYNLLICIKIIFVPAEYSNVISTIHAKQIPLISRRCSCRAQKKILLADPSVVESTGYGDNRWLDLLHPMQERL
jgi:hypothetical protein